VERRVGELEHRADDLDLIRITEIRDERDDRVSALEGAAEVFDEWRPWVEASIYDIRREMNRSNIRASSPMADGLGSSSAPPSSTSRPPRAHLPEKEPTGPAGTANRGMGRSRP
jgi:hypothetical protein